jgi:hypothetical protein
LLSIPTYRIIISSLKTLVRRWWWVEHEKRYVILFILFLDMNHRFVVFLFLLSFFSFSFFLDYVTLVTALVDHLISLVVIKWFAIKNKLLRWTGISLSFF